MWQAATVDATVGRQQAGRQSAEMHIHDVRMILAPAPQACAEKRDRKQRALVTACAVQPKHTLIKPTSAVPFQAPVSHTSVLAAR